MDFSLKKKSPTKETSMIFEMKVNSISKIDKKERNDGPSIELF